MQQLQKKRFEQWADQLDAIFATAGGSNRSENACGNRVSRKRNSVGNMAPNSAMDSHTVRSPLRAQRSAAKRAH